MFDQLATIGLVVFAYLLAGFVKGVIGMGLPTVALGILAAVITPAQAAAILIAPSLATNTWQMVAGPYLFGLVKRLGLHAARHVRRRLVRLRHSHRSERETGRDRARRGADPLFGARVCRR